jgi:hypothetical protein
MDVLNKCITDKFLGEGVKVTLIKLPTSLFRICGVINISGTTTYPM